MLIRSPENVQVFLSHLFKAHVDTITRKCTGLLIALSHARHVISSQALNEGYCRVARIIRPAILSVYGSCGTTQVRRIQKTVNFCARVVTGRRRNDHVSDAIRLLGWLTARQLIDFHTLCAVQRVIKYEETAYLYDTIGPRAAEIHEHNTRRASDWTLPRIRTEAGRRRLCYRGCSLLNEHRLDPADKSFCPLSKAAVKADDT